MTTAILASSTYFHESPPPKPPKTPKLTLPELYKAVTEAHEITDYRDIQPIHMAGFIAPDADAELNARFLRNYGYDQTKESKPKRRNRQRISTNRRNFNAGNVSSTLLSFDSSN